MLRNCTIYNGTYGIHLDNVSNGKLINNSAIDNTACGIYLYQSSNNFIYDNVINGMHVLFPNGILLQYFSINNIIDDNYIIHSYWSLYLYDNCFNNELKNNFIYNTSGRGLTVKTGCNNTSIVNNTVNLSTEEGICIETSPNCIIHNNSATYNVLDGIKLGPGSQNSSITENDIKHNSFRGAAITYSNNVTFENNSIFNCSMGLTWGYSDSGSISWNLIEKSGQNGIEFNAKLTNITSNVIKNNSMNGISMILSLNNLLENNTIIYNSYNGIITDSGTNQSEIKNNTCQFNGRDGITIQGYQNELDSNWILNNSINGLNITGNENMISLNVIMNNLIAGVNTSGDLNSIIQNIIMNNHDGSLAYQKSDVGVSNSWLLNIYNNLTDIDGDGLSDFIEWMIYKTDYQKFDSDNDYLGDGLEVSIGTNPLDSDTDDDNFSDGIEYGSSTDPLNPLDNPLTRNMFFIIPIIILSCVTGITTALCIYFFLKKRKLEQKPEKLPKSSEKKEVSKNLKENKPTRKK